MIDFLLACFLALFMVVFPLMFLGVALGIFYALKENYLRWSNRR